MSYEMIALLMFSSMMVMLLTGQRVFGAIGFVGPVVPHLLRPLVGAEVLRWWWPPPPFPVIRRPATPSPPNPPSSSQPRPSTSASFVVGRPATRHAISLAGSRHTVVLSTPGRKSAALGTGSGAGSVCENCVDSPPKNAPAPVRLLDASPTSVFVVSPAITAAESADVNRTSEKTDQP